MTTAQPITELETVTQHFALSNCKPYVDYNVGRFGAIVLLLDDDKSGVIVAYLPAGRIIDQRHADHLISIWRNRSDLAPLNVFDTAHEIEVVEGTLHVNFIEDDNDTQAQPITTGEQAAVNNIIAECTGIEQAIHILPEQHLHDDLGADSLDTVEILLYLEEHLDIEFPEQQFDTIHTVQDIYNAVGEAISNQEPGAEDGEWALGWAYRFGKGPECDACFGKGEVVTYLGNGREDTTTEECSTCHGSGVRGFKRKQQEQ